MFIIPHLPCGANFNIILGAAKNIFYCRTISVMYCFVFLCKILVLYLSEIEGYMFSVSRIPSNSNTGYFDQLLRGAKIKIMQTANFSQCFGEILCENKN